MSTRRNRNSVTIAFVGLLLVVLLSVILCPTDSHSADKEAELQKILQFRNEDEWKSLWHSEKHIRCRDQLLTHMDWACQKDIYRLDKKLIAEPLDIFVRRSEASTVIKPWNGYIRRRRESKSITDECCSAAGCTWEEYAEYCPAHRRVRILRSRT